MTRDPEVRYTQGENSLCIASFTVALDRRNRNQDQTADFPNCVAFGKTAEFIEKYFRKGMRIGGTGRIQTRSYENRNGEKVYVTEIVMEQAEFVESKSDSAPKSNIAKPQNDPLDGFMDIPDEIGDEELPFG
jgi:single-strand DNA-binding protein